MKNLWHNLFWAVSLLNLLGILLGNDTLIYLTKPLLMPALAAWFLSAKNPGNEARFLRLSILGALAFSTLGDILLMFSGGIFFLSGLGAFLLAHIFYIGAFTSVSSFKNGFLSQKPWWALPFFAFPLLLLFLLWNGIPSGMRLPVAAYASVISVMALSVLNLKGKIARSVFESMLLGAVLFVLSDSLIAVSKFGQPFEGARIAIMLTYIMGQFLLARGGMAILKVFGVGK